jgi:hypothetical protein
MRWRTLVDTRYLSLSTFYSYVEPRRKKPMLQQREQPTRLTIFNLSRRHWQAVIAAKITT